MSTLQDLVIILDNDRSILASLGRLLPAHGYAVRTHDNHEDFLRAGQPEGPACLILDYQLDGDVTGTAVHAEMHSRGWKLPTIFLTGHGTIPLVVRTMREGADGFLTKPCDPQQLLLEIDRALARSRALVKERAEHNRLLDLAATLTPREREVVILIVAGHLNKEVADLLGIALITVKVHRGRAMHKLGAGNAAELAQLAIRAGIVKPA